MLPCDRPLQEIEKFRRQTQHDGISYDPQKKVKLWADPNPPGLGRNATYDVIALTDDGTPLVGPDGFVVVEQLVIPRAEAMRTNIPPQYWQVTVNRNMQEEPMPLDLSKRRPNEKLVLLPMTTHTVVLRDMDAYAKLQEEQSSDDEVAELLRLVREIHALLLGPKP